MATLQDALALAKRGVPIFPLRAGTKDGIFTGLGDHGATTDPFQIYNWFKNGADLNIGSWAGHGLVIVDVDAHHGGSEAWAEVLREIGPVPATFEVRTPNGGRHLYFVGGSEAIGSSDLVKGKINVKAAGSYVVGPGSFFTDKKTGNAGRYEIVVDAPIAPLPDNLRGRLRLRGDKAGLGPVIASDLDTPDAIAKARSRLSWRQEAVEGESGDLETYKTACALLDFGLTEDTCFALMWELWNPKCVPPWEPEALRKKIENAWNYKTGAIGRDNAVEGFTPVAAPLLAECSRDVDGECKAKAAADTRRAEIEWADELAVDAEIDWLVDEAIPRVSFGYMVADPSEGKTQLAVQLALCLAYKQPYFGRQIGSCFGTVIVAAEGAYSIVPRLRASAEHGFSKITLPEGAKLNRWPIVRLSDPPDLLSAKGLREFIELLKTIDAAMRERYGIGLGLVIFDTFAAVFAVGDEDKASEVSGATRAMRDIANKLEVAVLTTHHYGKDKSRGLRGSTAHRANADFVFSIPKRGELWLDKCRDAEAGIPLGSFVMRRATMGTRRDGRPITSLYADCTPAPRWPSAAEGFEGVHPAREQKRQKPNRAAEALMGVFESLAPETGAIPLATVRAEFISRQNGAKPAARQAFGRARDKLLGTGVLAIINRDGQQYLSRSVQ